VPKILLLYHYYRPDDVVSAVHMTELAEGLALKGWGVEVWPGNRSCHERGRAYSCGPEFANGVLIRRVWRPDFPQHRFWGRLFNSIWIQKFWLWRSFFWGKDRPDVVLIGTDPVFALLVAPLLRLFHPKLKIVHWCFDLYPEAAVADGIFQEGNLPVRLAKALMGPAYRACDLVAQLGPCMAERLKAYPVRQSVTLTPWALEEPSAPLAVDAHERKNLFGEAKLCLLYSGNFGRAHEFYLTLKLARRMRGKAVFTYSARGSRMDALRKAVNPEDTNLRFAEFAPPDKLQARLSSTDIHVVSLREGWTGLVVPSKFFGALAAGRPVLFEGDDHSAIARWIEEYKVGWVLHAENIGELAEELQDFAKSDKNKMKMFRHCHEIYRNHFSKQIVLEGWEGQLNRLISEG